MAARILCWVEADGVQTAEDVVRVLGEFLEVGPAQAFGLTIAPAGPAEAAGVLGQIGGTAAGGAKQEAAQANGKFGGRPRKLVGNMRGLVRAPLAVGRLAYWRDTMDGGARSGWGRIVGKTEPGGEVWILQMKADQRELLARAEELTVRHTRRVLGPPKPAPKPRKKRKDLGRKRGPHKRR